MRLHELVIVASKSRYELEVERRGGEEEAKRHFRSSRVWDYIKESHDDQSAMRDRYQRVFEGQVIDRSSLTPERLLEDKYFVFLGGDNHFTYCAHLLLSHLHQHPESEKYAIGVSLDPKKSTGKLLGFTAASFLDSNRLLRHEAYDVEDWTTLEAKVNGGPIIPAVCDFYVGEENRLYMSRQIISLDGRRIMDDKSSGLIVAVGAGTNAGSWYDNAYQQMFGITDYLDKRSYEGRLLLTEHRDKQWAPLLPGQELEIDSFNDDRGIIVPDSHPDHGSGFMMGSLAKVRISDVKLPVIVPLSGAR